jgi:molybdopterin-guanine dinucleotide biosynthesis protein A
MSIKLTGIILAGGRSIRMGRDKGLTKYQGKYLVQYSIDLLKNYCDEILISTQQEEYLQFGIPLVPDELKGIGPAGGIYSGLRKASFQKMLFLGCDMPDLENSLLQQMILAVNEDDLVYLSLPGNILQPLPLAVDKNILPILSGMITARKYELRSFITSCIEDTTIKTHRISIDNKLKNINFVGDLEEE